MKISKTTFLTLTLLIAVAVIFFYGGWNRTSFNDLTTNNSDVVGVGSQPFDIIDFSQIEGTSILVAEVKEVDSSRYGGTIGSSSSRIILNGLARNLVFLDGNSLISHRLFEHNDNTILKFRQFSQTAEHLPNIQSDPKADAPTQWLVYEVVKEDSNDDGTNSRQDLRLIAVSDADGDNYVELIFDVQQEFGMTMIEAGKLIVTYQQNDVRKASILDLANRTVLITEDIVEIEQSITEQ